MCWLVLALLLLVAGGCGCTAVSYCCTAAEAADNSLGAPEEVVGELIDITSQPLPNLRIDS